MPPSVGGTPRMSGQSRGEDSHPRNTGLSAWNSQGSPQSFGAGQGPVPHPWHNQQFAGFPPPPPAGVPQAYQHYQFPGGAPPGFYAAGPAMLEPLDPTRAIHPLFNPWVPSPTPYHSGQILRRDPRSIPQREVSQRDFSMHPEEIALTSDPAANNKTDSPQSLQEKSRRGKRRQGPPVRWWERSDLDERGPIRKVPCTGCVKSARRGPGKGYCRDRKNAGRSKRCWGCGTKKCRPLDPRFHEAGSLLMGLSERKAKKSVSFSSLC
jgi:hypothetical protein